MTMQEIADALGVSKDSIRNCVRRIMPDKLKQGKTAFFDEIDVSRISMELKQNNHVSSQITSEAVSQVKNTTTELEIISNAIRAFSALQELYNRKEAEYKATIAHQERILLEQKPKVDFYNAVTDSGDCIDIGQVAKLLNCGYGRNTLFEVLRKKGVLDKKNQPYQKFVDAGYFRVIESSYVLPNGDQKINLKTVVYQKDVNFIRKIVAE